MKDKQKDNSQAMRGRGNHHRHGHGHGRHVGNSMMSQVLQRLRKNKTAMAGLCILIFVMIGSFIIPSFCPYGYNEMVVADRFMAPCAKHLLGTDAYGRDIFVRIWYGARFSLLLGILGSLLSLVIGVTLGLINGYIGGNFDVVFMRLIDIISAIPGTLLAITISMALGTGFRNTIIALSIGSIPLIIRLLRGEILRVRSEEYLEAAISINASPLRIMFKHMLPNVISPIIVNVTMNVGTIITEAAALSYLGLGIQPPNPEWGAMLSDGRQYIQYYPWLVIVPGCAIAIVVLAVNLFGDGLRDAIDPKLKK